MSRKAALASHVRLFRHSSRDDLSGEVLIPETPEAMADVSNCPDALYIPCYSNRALPCNRGYCDGGPVSSGHALGQRQAE